MTVSAVLFGLILCASADEAPDLVIRGGRWFDAEALVARKNGQLWIRDGRILGHREAEAAIPAGTRTLDAGGCVLLPGLFDLHVHLSVAGGGMGTFLRPDEEGNLASHLYCGVTHVVDLHHAQPAVFALREKTRDSPQAARVHAAGAAFTVPGGHGTQFGIPANTVTSAAEVERAFDALLPHQPDVVKAILEHGGWGGLPEMPTLDAPLFAAIAQRAAAAGVPLFVHVWSADEARTAVANGADALVHGVFEGEVDDALAAAMVEHDVAYVPTLAVVVGPRRIFEGEGPYGAPLVAGALDDDLQAAVTDERSESWATHADLGGETRWFRNLKRLADAGVRIGVGTDAGNPLTPHGPAVLFEITLLVEAGLTPAQALRAATADAAAILGVSEACGTLAAGKLADVVIVAGDPLAAIDDVWNVRTVVKDGVVVDRERLAARRDDPFLGVARVVPGEGVPATLDDFESAESAWGGTWVVQTDEVAGGASTAAIELQGGVLRLAGEVRPGFQWGAWSGVTLDWSGAHRLIDASDFAGFELRVRGTARPYSFTVHRAAVRDFNLFSTPLTVTEEWREVRIPFTALRQIGFGKPVDPGVADLTGLTIDARNPPFGEGMFGQVELEIDWIRLYPE